MKHDQWIYVVDDDEAERQQIAAYCLSRGAPAATFATAEDFLQKFERDCGGCVISDLRLRGMSGRELHAMLVAEKIRLPMILISAFADVPTTVDAMQEGVRAVLEKPLNFDELWRQVSQALAIDRRLRADERRQREVLGRMAALTEGERHVLTLILAGKTNKAIAKEMEAGLRTVEARRHKIMAKLQVQSLAELVQLVSEFQSSASRYELPTI